MKRIDVEAVKAEAAKQLAQEQFDAAVANEVVRLKTRKSLWHRIFPYAITIRRRQ